MPPEMVLVVDDDADTREMYSVVLSSAGFAVEEARDGEEAFRKATTSRPALVISDVLLPGPIDGFTLCRRLKANERTSHTPFIAISGYSAPTREQQAQDAGFDALLLKPVAVDVLLARITQTIAETRRLRAASSELRARAAGLARDTRQARDEITRTMRRLKMTKD